MFQVKVVKFSYMWTINNFSFCREEMGEVLAWNPTETPSEEENEGGDCKVNAGWLEAQRSIPGG